MTSKTYPKNTSEILTNKIFASDLEYMQLNDEKIRIFIQLEQKYLIFKMMFFVNSAEKHYLGFNLFDIVFQKL